MTEKEKIKYYLDFKGISKNSFYKKTGLSVGFLDSGNSLGVDKLKIIINAYSDISLEWIVLDIGEMIAAESRQYDRPPVVYVENPDKNDLITLQREKIRSLETELKELKRGSVGGFAASEDYNPAAEIISKMTHNKS